MSEKKYTIEQLRAARLEGLIEGRERGRKDSEKFFAERISHIKRTIRHLFGELLSLDRTEPIGGVLLPRYLCEAVIKKLREVNVNDDHARQIKYHMNMEDRRLLAGMKNFMKEVESG